MNTTKTIFAVAAIQTSQALRLQHLMDQKMQLAQTQGWGFFESIGAFLDDVVEETVDAFEDLGNAIADTAVTVYNEVGDALDTAVQVTGETFYDLGNGIYGGFNDAGQWVEGAYNDIANMDVHLQSPIVVNLAQTQGLFDIFTDAVEDLYEEVADAAEDAVDTITDVAEDALDAITGFGEEALNCGDSLENALECYAIVESTAQDIYQKAEDLANNAYSEAQRSAAIRELRQAYLQAADIAQQL